MIHGGTKQPARLEPLGHRITGDRRQGASRDAGDETVHHTAIGDATRLVSIEVLAGEQKAAAVGGSWPAPSDGSSSQGSAAVPPGSLRQWLRLAPRGLAMQPARQLDLKTDPHQGLDASGQRPSGAVHQGRPGGVGRPDRRPDIQKSATAGDPAIGGSTTAIGGLSPHRSRHRLRIAE